jgi:glycosyl transferase family 2
MKISVLMPTYKCPPELFEKALLSVLTQTHRDFEIIIKDGDFENPAINNPRIGGLIGQSDKIIYEVSPENADRKNFQNSYYEALNQCIKLSTGDILTVLSSDDERGPVCTLGRVNDLFVRHGPGPFCLYGVCEWIERDGKHIVFKQPPSIPVTWDNILTDNPFYTPSLFWNREVFTKFGLFDTTFPWCSDLDFYLKTWREIDSAFITHVVGRYRHWEVSQQRDNGLLAGAEGTRILEKWRALR